MPEPSAFDRFLEARWKLLQDGLGKPEEAEEWLLAYYSKRRAAAQAQAANEEDFD